jgi:F-type H+/Na+-transporting ATPase subunit alpha
MAERGRARGQQSRTAGKAATGRSRSTRQSDKQNKKDTRTMAELTIQPDEIRDALANFVEAYEPEGASRQEVGVVTEAGDGIARVEGLPSAMANELLEFPGGIRGLALNLDIREIGVVILGDFTKVEEGQQVRRTGEVLSVPVGDGFLGRVVDPLGVPLDGKGDIEDTELRALELQAPSVVQRAKVSQPLQTGIKAIDAMTPVGRGQRELIIGDRQTGKTAIAIDTILNQKDNWDSGDPERQVKCIYVAVGQKGSTTAQVRQALEEAGAMAYTTIVAAPASDPAGYKYIAPYTGSAIGQHWMYAGQHVLIIFDDLSKQAEAYRAVSLLLRRPPGREAYPGDVFYLHSRLLERCAKLSDDLGGGSLTGLPIIETKANDISAYIPTNVISITDGQIFLETDLFNSGVRPAINVGRSVSRVGGDAQIKAMKKVAGGLKLALSQYRDLEAFAAFSSDLDPVSRAQLDRGARLVELLKQPQYSPLPVERQVVSVWAGTSGYLDDVPVEDIRRFEDEFLDYLQRSHDGVYGSIKETGELNDDTATMLKDAIEDFRRQFEVSGGGSLSSDDGDGDRERDGDRARDRDRDDDRERDGDRARDRDRDDDRDRDRGGDRDRDRGRDDDRDRARDRERGGDRGRARDDDEPVEPTDEDRVEREKVTRRPPPSARRD